MIEIKFIGSADEVREEMARMLGLRKRETPTAPATIQPTHIDRARAVSGIAVAMNADTAEALETPIDAPQSAQDVPETKDEQTVAESAPEAPTKPESQPEPSAEEPETHVLTVTDIATGKQTEIVGTEYEITLVQARERMNGLRQKFGAKAVRQVLDTMGFPKFTDVPTEKYPELMVLCDAMEKGMENA